MMADCLLGYKLHVSSLNKVLRICSVTVDIPTFFLGVISHYVVCLFYVSDTAVDVLNFLVKVSRVA